MQIPLHLHPRGKGKKLLVRLYVMTPKQRKVYRDAQVEVARRVPCPFDEADVGLCSCVAKMLLGRNPTERDSSVFHRLRLSFPILRHESILALRRPGPPAGWLTATNIILFTGTGGGLQARHLEFTQEQALAYNDAISAVQHSNGVSRGDAWGFVNNTIGALLSGRAKITERNPIIESLIDAFPVLTFEEALALPRMTEQHMIDWSFTLDPEVEAEPEELT